MLHDLQRILLRRLLAQNGQRYGSLAREYSYEDNVVFHLKQLAEKGLVEKNDGIYRITTQGVKEITEYNLDDLQDSGCKTFFAGLLCRWQDNYLLKEHPSAKANFYNLPGGKPVFGEDIGAGLSKILTGYIQLQLPAKRFAFLSLHMKTVKNSEGEVLFDDAFTIYEVVLEKHEFEAVKPGNQAKWITREEITKLPNKWPEIDICVIRKDKSAYQAYEFVSDYIL